MTNKYLTKIAVEVQQYKNKTTDKQLAKRNTALQMVGGLAGPIGTVANAADHYYHGRDTTGALREYGKGGLGSLAGGVAAGGAGAGIGATIGSLVGGAKGRAVGAFAGGVGGAAAGAVYGNYQGRLSSIRNQIGEGRLKGVTKTAGYEELIEKVALTLPTSLTGSLGRRIGIGATMGASVGAATAGKDNRMKGALGGAALGAAAGGVLGKLSGPGVKRLASPVTPMANAEIIDRAGNVLNAPKLKYNK